MSAKKTEAFPIAPFTTTLIKPRVTLLFFSSASLVVEGYWYELLRMYHFLSLSKGLSRQIETLMKKKMHNNTSPSCARSVADSDDHGRPILSVVSSLDEFIVGIFFFSIRSYSDCLFILFVDIICFWNHKSFHSIFAYLVYQLCLHVQKVVVVFFWWF